MKYFTTFLLLIFVTGLSAQIDKFTEGEYQKCIYKKGTSKLNYQIMYPRNFDKNNKYPVVLFLHGAGERGTDNEKQMAHGSKLFRDSIDKYPAIVIFPQCETDDYWANADRPTGSKSGGMFDFHTDVEPRPSLALTLDLIDKILAEKYADTDRFYITGLSMGGMGTFETAWRIPEKIAAAVPICGGGPIEKAAEMKDIPFWIFHGEKDNIVHSDLSIVMQKAIEQQGGNAKITLYPTAGHNSWDNAFAEPEFLSWMFSQRK